MTSQRENVFLLGLNGSRIYEGDYVKCMAPTHDLNPGDFRRVQRIDPTNEMLFLNISPNRTLMRDFEMRLEWVPVTRFNIQTRHNAAHKRQKEEKEMAKPNTLYIAVRKLACYQSTVNRIEHSAESPLVPQEDIMANTSFEALKQDVNARIRNHPDEQWIITGATVLAEISAPPVTYRQL